MRVRTITKSRRGQQPNIPNLDLFLNKLLPAYCDFIDNLLLLFFFFSNSTRYAFVIECTFYSSVPSTNSWSSAKCTAGTFHHHPHHHHRRRLLRQSSQLVSHFTPPRWVKSSIVLLLLYRLAVVVDGSSWAYFSTSINSSPIEHYRIPIPKHWSSYFPSSSSFHASPLIFWIR